MVLLWIAVITVVISSICAEPVIRGVDVGHVEKGKVVKGDEFPYLVHMETSFEDADGDENVFDCAGILIKPKIVLTAAHCLLVCAKITRIFVWAGVSKLGLQSKLGQKNYAKYYRVHAEFGGMMDEETNPTYLHNDVGMLWLHKKFELKDGVQLAKLPQHSVVTWNKGWAAGWGLTENRRLSLSLKKVKLQIMPTSICEDFYLPRNFNGKNFCVASVREDTGVAPGDSGGPLVINGVVAGIVSYGGTYLETFPNETEIEMVDTSQPSVFSNLYTFNDWISWNIRDVAEKIHTSPSKRIGALCKKFALKYFRRGRILHKRRQWDNGTIKLPAPILI